MVTKDSIIVNKIQIKLTKIENIQFFQDSDLITVTWQKEKVQHEFQVKLVSAEYYESKKRYDAIFTCDYGLFMRTIYCKKTKYNSKKETTLFIAVPGACFKKNGQCFRVLRQTIQSSEKTIKKANSNFKCVDFFQVSKQKKNDFNYFICYDVETCADKNNQHQVYLAYFNLYDSNFELVESKKFSFFDFVAEEDDETNFNFIDEFYKWWQSKFFYGEFRFYYICLFGFNNHRFDNHFLYDFFLNNRYDVHYKERFGKTTQGYFSYNHIHVYLCDLITWLPEKSLKEALEDYECASKDDLKIVPFNKMLKESNYDFNKFKTATKVQFESCFTSLDRMGLLQVCRKYKTEGGYNLLQAVDDYCKQDVDATWELYKKIQNNFIFIVEHFHQTFLRSNIFYYISPSQIAGIMLNHHLSKTSMRMEILNEDWFNFLNESFYGGRVDFSFIGEYYHEKGICCMDVTSMYPLAMTGRFPLVTDMTDVVYGEHITELLQQIVDKDLCFQQLFIAECRVELPEDLSQLCSFGPLPNRQEGKLIFNNRNFDSKILTSAHVKTAQLFGYKITILKNKHNVLFVKSAFILNELVQTIIAKKAESKETNKALGKLYKLFANSFHGKLSQKVIARMHETVKVNNYKQNIKFETKDYNKSRIYLAAFVTSYANYILMQACYFIEKHFIDQKIAIEDRRGSILYCDTDSIFFSVFDPRVFENFNINESLGYFDKNTNDYVSTWNKKYANCNSMVVLGKKSYFVMRVDGSLRKMLDTKLKGIHRNEMEQFTYNVVMDKIVEPYLSERQASSFSVYRNVLQRKRNYINQFLEEEESDIEGLGREQIQFEGLLRKPTHFLEGEWCGNADTSFKKDIFETVIKKSLQINVPKAKKIMFKDSNRLCFFYS